MGRGPTQAYYQVLNEDYVKGTLTCLKPSTIKKALNNNFPKILNIEPTNRCNLRCVYCPRQKADKGIGLMDWDLYKRLIDEASAYEKLIMLHLFKDGEPFLHPRFIDMIRYAKKKEVAKTIHLNTNALCWTDRVIDEMLDSGVDDITVSLDAARPETYLKHKGADRLAVIEKQVRRFFKRRTQMSLNLPFTRVKIIEFDQIPKEEIEEFMNKWHDIADAVQVTGIHSWSGAIADLEVTDEQSPVRYPCVIMWYALVVNWNGEVTSCSVDWNTEIKLGHAGRQTLHQIWNSQKLKDARKAQIQKKYDQYAVCKNCVVWVSSGDLSAYLGRKREFYQ